MIPVGAERRSHIRAGHPGGVGLVRRAAKEGPHVIPSLLRLQRTTLVRRRADAHRLYQTANEGHQCSHRRTLTPGLRKTRSLPGGVPRWWRSAVPRGAIPSRCGRSVRCSRPFRLADERRRRGHAEEGDLGLEVSTVSAHPKPRKSVAGRRVFLRSIAFAVSGHRKALRTLGGHERIGSTNRTEAAPFA